MTHREAHLLLRVLGDAMQVESLVGIAVGVGIHVNGLDSAEEALPNPALLRSSRPDMIDVGDDHFLAVRSWRVDLVGGQPRRNPICGAFPERLVVGVSSAANP